MNRIFVVNGSPVGWTNVVFSSNTKIDDHFAIGVCDTTVPLTSFKAGTGKNIGNHLRLAIASKG